MDHKIFNYYSNPAFCQQSEFPTNSQPIQNVDTVGLSPEKYIPARRETPIGANSTSPQKAEKFYYRRTNNLCEFKSAPTYRKPDDKMSITEKQLNASIISKLQLETQRQISQQYPKSPKYQIESYGIYSPKYEIESKNQHRYAIIPTEDEDNDKYSEDEDEIIEEMTTERVKFTQNHQDNKNYQQQHFDINGNSTPIKTVNQNSFRHPVPAPRSKLPNQSSNTTPTKKYNPIATQKLHELLISSSVIGPKRSNSVRITPQKRLDSEIIKRRAISPPPEYKSNFNLNHIRYESQEDTSKEMYFLQSSIKSEKNLYSPNKNVQDQQFHTPKKVPQPIEQYFTPNKIDRNQQFHTPIKQAVYNGQYYSPSKSQHFYSSSPNLTPSKVHQKLIYSSPTKKKPRENTAIIQPIYNSRNVYKETTFSEEYMDDSWMDINHVKPTFNKTLACAAIMLVLCGALTSGLSFYVISWFRRKYYLDFSLIAGFTCFVLGLLGFRTSNCKWLPNRNYISGYIVLSVFSLLTCSGLLVMLGARPKPGSPLGDITTGAVCGLSALIILLASLGVITSYCCKYPPPDNRVEHCAPGITV